jgi:hypothetical protein
VVAEGEAVLQEEGMNKVFGQILDAWAVCAFVSIFLYAFTGLHFWSALEVNQYGSITDTARVLALMFFHMAPLFIFVMRRVLP